MRYVGLDYMPGSWLRASCIPIPVHVIRHIIGKRMSSNRAEYQVGWVGHEGDEPTWQALRDLPPGSRYLVNGYNGRLRVRREQQAAALGTATGGGGSKSTHRFVGKQVAKDFSYGAVYVGHMTERYPPDLDNGEMTGELFYVEYDDRMKKILTGGK
jgi:hypothetical protein